MSLKDKLCSRKLWVAIAGIIVGLVTAFGGDPETIQSIAGSTISVVACVSYIIGEAIVDSSSAKSDTDSEETTDKEDI